MVQLKHITKSSFDMTVLLIDDDEKLANGLKAFLKKFNIKVMLEHRIATAEKNLEDQVLISFSLTLCCQGEWI